MNRIAASLAIALLATTLPVLAQKPTVDVAFAIADGHLYDKFSPANEAAISTKVAADVSALLATAYPLFDFATRPASNHLSITLEDRRADSGVAPAVVLTLKTKARVLVDGQPFLSESIPYQVMFRGDEERGEPTGGAVAFAGEIVAALRNSVTTNSSGFVTGVLAPINVTTEVFPLPHQRVFVMPFTATAYLIGRGSRFRVTATGQSMQAYDLEAQAGDAANPSDVPAKFQRGLCLSADRPETAVAQLPAEQGVRADGVHLLKYDRLIPDPPPIPPSALRTNRGGR